MHRPNILAAAGFSQRELYVNELQGKRNPMDIRTALNVIWNQSNMIKLIPMLPGGEDTEDRTVVYSVDGELVPELELAISQQTFPVLPRLQDIVSGLKPVVEHMILHAAENPRHRPMPFNRNLGVSFRYYNQRVTYVKVVDKDTGNVMLESEEPVQAP